METDNQSWSLIVLCYNEAGSIQVVMQDALVILEQLSPDKGQLIIVNDGSTDYSDSMIRKVIESNLDRDIKYLKHSSNLGIGISLKRGYSTATNENVAMIPGDGQFNLAELLPYQHFKADQFLSFYRKENHEYSFIRKVLTSFNRWLNKRFLKLELKDVNWIKVYKAQALKELELKSRSSLIETEICSKLTHLGYNAVEIESHYLPRTAGKSKGSSWKIIKQALIDLPFLIINILRFKMVKTND